MKTLLQYLGIVAAVALTLNITPGIFYSGGWPTIFLIALAWSVIILVIRPILQLLTLPITIITLGLFALVLNAFLFYAMTWIVPGFTVAGYWSALLGSVILSVFIWLIQKII